MSQVPNVDPRILQLQQAAAAQQQLTPPQPLPASPNTPAYQDVSWAPNQTGTHPSMARRDAIGETVQDHKPDVAATSDTTNPWLMEIIRSGKKSIAGANGEETNVSDADLAQAGQQANPDKDWEGYLRAAQGVHAQNAQAASPVGVQASQLARTEAEHKGPTPNTYNVVNDQAYLKDLHEQYRDLAGVSGMDTIPPEVKDQMKNVLGEMTVVRKRVGDYYTDLAKGKGKTLDQATAMSLKQEAGGDNEKARALAKQRGYDF